MSRLLVGALVLFSLLVLVSGCGNEAQPPSADEAARQSAITQQGAVNAPAPGNALGGAATSTPAH